MGSEMCIRDSCEAGNQPYEGMLGVGAVVMNRYMGMKGVKYFTGITLLDSLHGYVVAPMMLLAIVFLGITIGTLSQNRKEEEAVRNSYDSVTGI